MQQFQAQWVPKLRKGQLVPIYLIASYLYYHCDKSLMTDEAYDALCVRLLNEWNTVQHRHKRLVTVSALRQTTGYNIRRRSYPTMVILSAHSLYEFAERNQLHDKLFPALRSRIVRKTAAPTPPRSRIAPRRFAP